MTLLDGRSLKAPGARDLSFCPAKANLLAWWTVERDNAPVAVTVMRLPGREVVRQRNLFNVDSACARVLAGGGGGSADPRPAALTAPATHAPAIAARAPFASVRAGVAPRRLLPRGARREDAQEEEGQGQGDGQ